MSDKLLRCPMCGSKPQVNYGHTHSESWAYVVCVCGVRTSNQHGKTDKDAASSAIAVWNRRTGLDDEDDHDGGCAMQRLFCVQCGLCG